MNRQEFYMGNTFDAYEYFGAHLIEGGVVFRTFAPSAARVSLIGEFNDWEETPMYRSSLDQNFYECTVPRAEPGMMYKYKIYQQDGRSVDHCDPYGFGMELRPACASVIRDLTSFAFSDREWMARQSAGYGSPVNIYELHLGSWKSNPDDENGWYNYEELAKILIPYVKKAGYNYIECMPLSEHPCDESWGYQNTGFFSPTSRYGTAEQLMKFVDACHQQQIGVLLDFVPVHFAVDYYGLANYDGTPLYEYPNSAVGQSEWGSCNFMHSRGEVRSFLQSAANYWLKEYHFDGLRMDAISRLIYWQGDPARGVNGNAVDFIRNMNAGLKQRHPGSLLAAEDSTNFPGITASVLKGGLGFDYKWDMGWMNDTLQYFQTPPDLRTRDYHKLTFSMAYYYNERYLLPLSHDEVVHGKATIAQKMYGDYEEKFPQARAFYLYMYAHPGKKLNFMGNEIAQLREWDEKREQDWMLLSYPVHESFNRYMEKLNHLYLECPGLSEEDYTSQGFSWLDCSQEEKCVYAFLRRGKKQLLAAVFNFSDKSWKDFPLPAEKDTPWKLLLNTDWDIYGGCTPVNTPLVKPQKAKSSPGQLKWQVILDIPAYSGQLFQIG